MTFSSALHVRRGVTAVIGGGGKTTLLRRLGEELQQRGTVLLCTTTKMYPFSDLPWACTAEELDALRQSCRLLCAGAPLGDTGKLTTLPVSMAELAARFDYVLVEADGSAGRPMKAHASHEPVIPSMADQTILVLGASGFGRPIAEAAHRPELYARLTGSGMGDAITPQLAAKVLLAEGLHTRVLINQVETAESMAAAESLAKLLDCPTAAGSAQKGDILCLL